MMPITRTRNLAITILLLIAGCVHQQGGVSGELKSVGTITFRNQSRDRIQVYLIGEREDWLLGRLESLESAEFRLPESAFRSTAQSIVLAVIPDWSRNLQPRRDPRATLSLKEPLMVLAGEEWIFVSGQFQGPFRGQARGHL
jgi:hypothetical protein